MVVFRSKTSDPPGRLTLVLQVILAYFASALVKEYAIYAKHSGIPEMKTILGGFVIRKFLGLWTLITKSIGLVSLLQSTRGCCAAPHANSRVTVSRCWLRDVAGKRGTLRACSMLRCQPIH